VIKVPLQIIVQKYGGSSLSTIEKVQSVASKIVRSAAGGRPLVVVVSAMGGTTSELIERAKAVSPSPPRRELDMLLSSGERMSMALLAMAIEREGHKAISLTGPQCGIVTDNEHANARILEVVPDRVRRELQRGKIVIVAGYQGVSRAGEVTTLGRGGSDTTALALAGALDATRCEIYSDVPGVYTADPRLVDGPLHLKSVPSELMTEYALRGARVLHPDCIAFAHEHKVPLHALATFGDDQQTVISTAQQFEFTGAAADDRDAPLVVGVTSRKSRLRMIGSAGHLSSLDRQLEDLGLSALELLRHEAIDHHDYLVDLDDVPDPEITAARLREVVDRSTQLTNELSSVSIVAPASSVDRVHVQVEALLRQAGAPPVATYRRPLSVTCAVHSEHRKTAVRALHQTLIEEPLALTS
jgi:aspartate kinase